MDEVEERKIREKLRPGDSPKTKKVWAHTK